MTRVIFILAILAVAGCTHVPDNIDFLRARGVMETQRVPLDFEKDPSWETLTANYVYFLTTLDPDTEPKLVYLVADKKAKRLTGYYDIIDQLMPAAVAPGSNYPITNFEEISDADRKRANDMSAFNELLRTMPELKNFSWKNETQNRIVSGIMMKTQFISITKPATDRKLFSPTGKSNQPDQRSRIREMYKTGYALRQRSVERLNAAVPLNEYIEKLGFQFEDGNIVAGKKEKFYINDLLADDPIDFSGKGKMFFFTPVRSYVRSAEEGADPVIEPAVQTFEFSYTLDKDQFPVFTRNTHVASLLAAGDANAAEKP